MTKAKPKTITTVKAKPAPKAYQVTPARTLAMVADEQLLQGIEATADAIGVTQEQMINIVGHPLFPVVCAAIGQAAFGKGERHGGSVTPFLSQPWAHYARMHGRGFLTGQAAKKLEEAAHQRDGDAYVLEMLGAIVYAGMSVLHEQGETSIGGE